ncbi:MAG TPA: molybdopterin-dependent oxidoreductase [Candidatus Binatia bacterium]|nr:molybdopterin-dependent oxidoreductase [Candidatus Binatia bacterium]
MRKITLKLAVFLGLLSSFPLIAISYLGSAVAGLSFIPFDLFDWLTRVLPGSLVTFGIDNMVATLRAIGLSVSETAKLAEQLTAILIVIAIGALLGLLLGIIERASDLDAVRAGLLAGSPLFILLLVAKLSLGLSGSLLLTVIWLFLLTVGWGAALGYALDWATHASGPYSAEQPQESVDASRRDALLKLTGAAAGITLGAWGLGRLARSDSATVAQESGASQPLSTLAPSAPGATAAAPNQGVEIPPTPSGRITVPPGTREEVTGNQEFYRIDINTRPPVIDGSNWQLEVGGLFQNPRNMTIDDLMSYESVTQPITLSCISNRVAGDLIGTSYWTGVRLRDVLEDLQLSPEAGALYLESEDGFYETVVAEDMMDERTLLVYGMNGETLPVEHGFPLRIYIPNRYGMKQPKWIIRMEAIEVWMPGYWVERGWSREARPKIVSVIDTVGTEVAEDGTVPLGGIAWAGGRGIQMAEVSVDDGPWQEAQLKAPPLSQLTWVQWRYDWPQESGRHTFTVRATDGTGELQTAEVSDPHPDGATGYHSVTRTI